MDEERFKYLMNTLPWNLSPEDSEEAKQLRKDMQPAFDAVFGGIFDKYNDQFEGKDNA